MITIKTAMILAAGRGTRMKHLTDHTPKPLISVCGKTLLGHLIKKIRNAHIENIVVNTCYKSEMIKQALSVYQYPDIHFSFSDEEIALETGGGVKKALPLLLPSGKNGFFVLNADPLWEESTHPLLNELMQKWNPSTMDILLALVPIQNAYGDVKEGDYFIENNVLRRKNKEEKNAPYLYMGVQILHPRIFENTPNGAFSLRDLYDIAQQKKRLSYIIYDGRWFHVGTPEALKQTETLFDRKEE